MNQGEAEQVAKAVLNTFQALPKTGKPQPHEHAVLAGLVLRVPTSELPHFHVISLGTGTKCLGGSRRSAQGTLLHDSHAEVITRRAFMLWLYKELHKAIQELICSSTTPALASSLEQADNTQAATALSRRTASTNAWLVYDSEAFGFKLRDGLSLHMYISQLPCGDSSIIHNSCCAAHPAEHSAAPFQHDPASNTAVFTAEQTLESASTPNGKVEECQGGTCDMRTAAASDSTPPVFDPDTTLASTTVKLRTGAKALRLTLTEHPLQSHPHEYAGAVSVVATTAAAAVDVYLPQAGDVEEGDQRCGILRRKPGKGDATLSLSCSDKIAKWCCCGLQGALLSGFMSKPLYLISVVVAMPQEVACAGAVMQEAALSAVRRAVSGRLQGEVEASLQLPHHLSQPQIYLVNRPPEHLGLGPSVKRKKGSGSSINWVMNTGFIHSPTSATLSKTSKVQPTITGSVEVTTAADGFRAGASKAQVAAGKAQSRLCRAVMAHEALTSVKLVLDAGLPGVETKFGGIKALMQQSLEAQAMEATGVLSSKADMQLQGDDSAHRAAESGTLTYQTLKQELGKTYLAVWHGLRQQGPFKLWILKPAHLQAFPVSTS